MTTIKTSDIEAIRALNDKFRKSPLTQPELGRYFATYGVRENGPKFLYDCYVSVRDYAVFDKGNDPYNEHDFGSFRIDNQQVHWKIDYYDKKMEGASENPADPAVTYRVLTVMLAEEY